MTSISKPCVLITVLMALALGVSLPSLAQADDDRVLAVNGEARIKVPADWASFQVGVETLGDDADKALNQNTKALAKVKQALLKAGVKDSEINTSRFNVSPRWQPRPQNSLSKSDWKPKIIGYQVSAYLRIETASLTKVGEWLQVAVESGASSVNGLSFDLQNPDEHRMKALAKATEQAKAFAKSAADAAGVTLKEITLIEVNGASHSPVAKNNARYLGVAAEAASMPVDVDPGDIDVWAQVRLSFRIE